VRFAVDPETWELFPDMRLVVAVADGIDNREDHPRVDEL
jgi:DNA/RNA-binding domain of Phe-tRNA-synthetase-like protein